MGSGPDDRHATDEHVEIEVKLRVPDDLVDAVERAVRELGHAHVVRLRAEYVDTDDWALAEHGLTWRMRHEGDRWVQTLKGRLAGATSMSRIEHDVDVTGRASASAAPPLDAALHAGPAGQRLAGVLAALGERAGDARPQFTTDVVRIECRASNEHGTVVLALDRGHIAAGGAQVPVSELEIELVDGAPEAVLAEADRWATRFGLERDPVNKARRGRRLADEQRSAAPPASGAGSVGAPEGGR